MKEDGSEAANSQWDYATNLQSFQILNYVFESKTGTQNFISNLFAAILTAEKRLHVWRTSGAISIINYEF